MIICLLCVSSLFQEHFLEVIQNQEFLLLPTAEIVKLLSSDDINVPDEETIFQALMMWVRYDVQLRQKDLGVLLAFIRLPLLPPQVSTLRGERVSFLPLLLSLYCHSFLTLNHLKSMASCYFNDRKKNILPSQLIMGQLFIYLDDYCQAVQKIPHLLQRYEV